MANIYGIDLGTCNLKIFSKHSNKIIKEKNTIAVINKNQLYAYGDEAYAMYEKAPENINVSFPVTGGVIADRDAKYSRNRCAASVDTPSPVSAGAMAVAHTM